MKEQLMPKADFITSILLMIFSLSIVIISIRMPRMQELGANPYSAPGIVPGFLGVIIFMLSLALCMKSVLKNGYTIDLHKKTIRVFFQDQATIRVLLTLFISIIYGVGFLGNISYILATFVYVAGFIMLFEYRCEQPIHTQKKTVMFAMIQAILVTASVAAVFRYLFLVNLP
ncbi:hypothetical protein U27_01203 [Candidatus Vecturithrix granuli]|uniref:DUF1468 domain-containing protein n=1 Tax=Vecturithrix granuli TaxID=1499967 RepID=A0A081C9P8_VECG1|nr:hypothetical protein U27_01203 [Candidatus Vecturithrix granuli]